MKIENTLTFKDINEIPALLEEFSKRTESLKKSLLKSKRDKVYLVGRGSSGNATLFAKYVWEGYCGVITNFIRPHSVFTAKLPLNFKNEVVWAFSQSGKSRDITACLKKLMVWGAKGVAVTNEKNIKKNSLARIADKHILLSNSKEIPVAATKSFILQLWSVLWTAHIWNNTFTLKDFNLAQKKIKDFISNNAFLDGEDEILNKIKKASVLGFVGRGPYNAIAADSALKFREMARAHSLAYSAAEFLHGPVGSYSSKDFVFLFSPSKKVPEDILKVEKDLKARKTPYEIIIPNIGKYPFNCLLVDIKMKLLALKLALKKGLNPDNPKGLNKVTDTF
ncbi:MAG: SIS domain-containing protein [Elusimicrobiota bacterium]|nr:SIS domain-containing protein [Elusimicrobiota bacterium]